MPLAGGDAVPLTTLSGDEWWPRWSPDGREIAFYAAAPRSPDNSQVMVMPAEGGPPSALTNSPGRNGWPAWSPSGLAIAFQSDRTGSFRLWLLSRDRVGGAWHEAVQLTDFGCFPTAWAPDGSGVLCDDYGKDRPRRDLVLVTPQGRTVWRRDDRATYGLDLWGLWRFTQPEPMLTAGRASGPYRRRGARRTSWSRSTTQHSLPGDSSA